MKINVDTGVIMQKINLYAGMAVAGVVLVPQILLAAECAVTDCSLLGYTDSACPGSGLKCPFGDGWYCGGGAAEDCIKLGYDKECNGVGESGNGETCNGKYQSCSCEAIYQYSCSGTGYAGGLEIACGGKYTQCSCSAGYEWKGGSCQQKIADGPNGNLYYCNGRVVGVRASGMSFYVAMQDLGYMDRYEGDNKCSMYVFCNGDLGSLPPKSFLSSIYKNKSTINNLLSQYGGKTMTEDKYWSSTYEGYGTSSSANFVRVFYVSMVDGREFYDDYYSGRYNIYEPHYIRPILMIQ